MNQLEAWHKAGVIQIEMAQPAQDEAARGDSDRARKARGYVYNEKLAGTSREQESLREIEAILFPSGASGPSERNDVEIVFIARKYDCILVTGDGGSRTQPRGILGSRQELLQLGVEVLSNEDAVERVRKLIAQRDQQGQAQ